MDNKFERVATPDDPNRCQGGGAGGQCPFKAIPTTKYCPRHGGNITAVHMKAKLRRQYDFAQWQASIDGFSEYDDIKSLREEVGVMRMLLQNLMSLCSNESDLLLYTGKISEIIAEIKTLVLAMHKLDISLGSMLDKSAALTLAANLVQIVSEEVTDVTIADRIGQRFANTILKGNEDVQS